MRDTCPHQSYARFGDFPPQRLYCWQPRFLVSADNEALVLDVVCYFITVAVPDQCVDLARGIVPRGFSALPIANSSANSALPTGFSTFLLTSGGCSCGLYQRESSGGLKPTREQVRQKYLKKGWSESKIERAIRQAETSHSQTKNFLGFRADVVGILSNMASEMSKLALLIHWYNGNVVDERIKLGQPQSINIERLGEIVPEVDRWLWVNG